MKRNKLLHLFIIFSFVSLYILVSIISMVHVIKFFELSNSNILAVTLAIAFEIGTAASLASIVILDKMNKWIVWGLFFVLTIMQMMGNTFYAYENLGDFNGWVELFGLSENTIVEQKRILSIISGGILPLVALGFIKSLVDYIRPENKQDEHININKNISSEENVEIDAISDDVIENKTLKQNDIIADFDTIKNTEFNKAFVEKKDIIDFPDHNQHELTKKDIEQIETVISDIEENKKTGKITKKIPNKQQAYSPTFKKMVEEYINKTKNKVDNK